MVSLGTVTNGKVQNLEPGASFFVHAQLTGEVYHSTFSGSRSIFTIGGLEPTFQGGIQLLVRKLGFVKLDLAGDSNLFHEQAISPGAVDVKLNLTWTPTTWSLTVDDGIAPIAEYSGTHSETLPGDYTAVGPSNETKKVTEFDIARVDYFPLAEPA